MDTKPSVVINKETLIPLSVAGLVFLACISCFVWMSTVYAKVESANKSTEDLSKKIEKLENERSEDNKELTNRHIELTNKISKLEGLLINKK